MPEFDWERLLAQWSRQALECPEITRDLPPDVVRRGWLGYAPATEEEIRMAELRLGTTLPPSYREFFSLTNGWRRTGPYVPAFWSTEDVNWFRIQHPDWIDVWFTTLGQMGELPAVPDEEYFVYGENQRTDKIRDEYLRTALAVSEEGDECIYLLNPEVVTRDGEWEAWFFASWLAGAARYQSFWELMSAEHERFVGRRASLKHHYLGGESS